MTEITPKRLLFARHYVLEKFNGTAAAIKAGYSERTAKSQAAQMLALPAVKVEIDRLQAAYAEASNVTMEKLYQGLALAFEVALAKENASAMNQILVSIAKLSGKWIERHEDIGERDRHEAERLISAQTGEVKKAAEILAEMVESYGLPKDATPAQIVGAISSAPLVTPEAFKLLRQAAINSEQEAINAKSLTRKTERATDVG